MTGTEYEKYLREQTFLNRYKSDNSYIARVATEYLQVLYPKDARRSAIRVVRGAETALLRKAWNLNGITDDLAKLHINNNDSSENNAERVKDKKRDDCRHHALDAIVVAYCGFDIRNLINKLSGMGVNTSEIMERIPLPKYFMDENCLSTNEQRKAFRTEIEKFIFCQTYVSKKVRFNSNGAILKDTCYQIVSSNDVKAVLVTKKKLTGASVKTFHGDSKYSLEGLLTSYQIPSQAINESRLRKIIEHNNKQFESVCSKRNEALAKLKAENEENKRLGKKERSEGESDVLKKAMQLCGGFYYQISNKDEKKIFITRPCSSDLLGVAYDTGDNYCLDLYRNADKSVGCEIIRKVDRMKSDHLPEYRKRGLVLIERIYPKDILEVDSCISESVNKNGDKVRKVYSPNAPQGRTFVTVATFTETGNTVQVYFSSLYKSKGSQDGSFRVSNIDVLNVRKVKISPAGLVEYRSRIIRKE